MSAISLLLALVAVAQQASQLPISVERYVQIRRIVDVRPSPDGSRVAVNLVEAGPSRGAYRSTVYLWREGGVPLPITSDLTAARMPRWSPGGARVAFLASADAEPPQIWWVHPEGGGRAERLSDLSNGVLEFGWASDSLMYLLTPAESGAGREIWRIRTDEGAAEYVWGADAGARELAINPDGRSIAFSTNGSGAVEDYHNYDLKLLDLEEVRIRELTSRAGSEVAPAWSADGQTIAFRAPQSPSSPFSQTDLFTIDLATGTLDNLTDSFDRSVLDHRWPASGDLLFSAAIGAHTHLFAMRKNGAVELVGGGQHNYGVFDASSDGTSLFTAREAADAADELWRIEDGGVSQLTRFNQDFQHWDRVRQEVIRWESPDGLSIEGLLIYPGGYREGRRYPLIVDPAGGPLARARDVLDQPAYYPLFASHGYAVLAVNPRGSIGYGEGFGTAPRQTPAGSDLTDILSGIDHVIQVGLADPKKLAVFGGGQSAYGAHLAAWIVGQTSRFSAAVALYNASLATDSHSGDAQRNPAAMAQLAYLEVLERERSPLEAITRSPTPILLVERDPGTLISHPRQLYSARRQAGRATELWSLAAGQESAATPQQRVDLFIRLLRWFDKFLKFDGADLVDFYLVGEPVPGPGGWQLRVEHATARSDYSGIRPSTGRFLEIALKMEPSEAALRRGSLQDIEIDPTNAVALIGPDSLPRAFAGTVTELFGNETLIMGLPSTVRVSVDSTAAPTALRVRLAFEISDEAAEYRLRIIGFVPIRIWVAEGDRPSGEGE